MGHLKVFLYPRIIKSAFYFIVNTPATTFSPGSHDQGEFQELEVGIDLHRVIAEISGNIMLHGMLCGILDKCQHYVWTELLWLDEWKIARDEHAGIIEAVCAGDVERAGKLARAHVRGSRENTPRLLQARSDYQSFLAKAS
jgi:DNA-binding GntR family transcriptional regulator